MAWKACTSIVLTHTTTPWVGRGCGVGRRQAGLVTFDLELGRVPDLCSGVAGHAREVPRVAGIEARNAEEARIGVKGRHIHPQRGCQRLTVLEPWDNQGLVPVAHAAYRTGSHAFRQPVLKGKGLNDRRNWERREKQTWEIERISEKARHGVPRLPLTTNWCVCDTSAAWLRTTQE